MISSFWSGKVRATVAIAFAVTIFLSTYHTSNALKTRGEQPFYPVFELTEPLVVARHGSAQSKISKQIPFNLAGNGQQGATGWYILDAFLRLTFSSSADSAAINYATVSTNGATALQIKIAPFLVADQRAVHWSTTELFSGESAGVATAKTLTIRFRNYLQIRGVNSGHNALELGLESLRGEVVQKVELLSESSIEYGHVGPSTLNAELLAKESPVEVGNVVSLNYRISSGGLPIRKVEVSVRPNKPGVAPLASWTVTDQWVIAEEGTVRFLALEPSVYTFSLKATGSVGGTRVATTKVEVVDYDIHKE